MVKTQGQKHFTQMFFLLVYYSQCFTHSLYIDVIAAFLSVYVDVTISLLSLSLC